MKKLVLLFTGMLMGLTTVTATETLSKTQIDDNFSKNKRYHHAQPILFVERGIEFIIFPNGDFDFNTATDTYGYNGYGDDDMYYRKGNTNSRRGSVSVQVGDAGTTSRYYDYGPRGVQVMHDRYGNVRRVGHVFINYDYYGRVKRIGSVYVRYHRNKLIQVGGLKLIYNRHGKFIKTRGRVNRHWNHNWTYNHFNFDNDWDNDDDHYYYRKNGKKVKKSKKNNRKTYKREVEND